MNKHNVNRSRFQKDNDESDRRQSNETCENDNNHAFHNIDNDNEEDDSDTSNNSDTSNACGIIVDNNNFCDINDCEVEMEDDFTTSHLAKWCRTLNVPMTHVNVLLKDIRKHKCFKTVFPLDIRTILGTPKFTPLKSVPPGEYYHQGLKS